MQVERSMLVSGKNPSKLSIELLISALPSVAGLLNLKRHGKNGTLGVLHCQTILKKSNANI